MLFSLPGDRRGLGLVSCRLESPVSLDECRGGTHGKLGGALIRPRSVLTVRITGLCRTCFFHATLDTGLDDTDFGHKTAVAIGIDLNQADKCDLGSREWLHSSAPSLVVFCALRLECPGSRFRRIARMPGLTVRSLRQLRQRGIKPLMISRAPRLIAHART